MEVDDIVLYDHPSWGPSRGRVLRVGGQAGPDDTTTILVQDLADHGACEWWPAADVRLQEGP